VRIVVDRVKCGGLGMCEVEAGDLFEVQGDRSLVIRNHSPGADRQDAAEAAMMACPTEALSSSRTESATDAELRGEANSAGASYGVAPVLGLYRKRLSWR
jgi:ferredoxin